MIRDTPRNRAVSNKFTKRGFFRRPGSALIRFPWKSTPNPVVNSTYAVVQDRCQPGDRLSPDPRFSRERLPFALAHLVAPIDQPVNQRLFIFRDPDFGQLSIHQATVIHMDPYLGLRQAKPLKKRRANGNQLRVRLRPVRSDHVDIPLEKFAAAAFLRLLSSSDLDRKSTRLNSSHRYISYAVFCLKKKN